MPDKSKKQIRLPNVVVTDTIIVGIKYKGGVMIATDIRSQTSKIYRLHDNIYAAVTGFGQDSSTLVNVIQCKLALHYMNTNYRRVPVRCANQMAKQLLHSQEGCLNANLLIAGVDKFGAAMYSTRFDGSSDTVPFSAIGSGMLSAFSVLETRWHIDLDEAAARDVIYEAVVLGTGQVVSSRSPVHLCIMKNDYTVVHQTLGSVEQAPKIQAHTLTRIVPKIRRERVERVEPRTPRRWRPGHCAAKERGEGSEIENEKSEVEGQGKLKEEKSNEQKE